MIIIKHWNLLFSVSLIINLAFFYVTYSQTQSDSSFYPLAIGNRWIYNSIETFAVDTETIVDTQRVSGKLYYGLAINSTSPFLWLRNDSNKVYVTTDLPAKSESTSVAEYILYNFSAEFREKWSINLNFQDPLLSCDYNGEISLINKEYALVTLVGIFRNCYVFSHNPPCSDAGRMSETFARGVGRVFYYENNIWGWDGYVLAKSNLVTSVSSQNHSQSVTEYHLLQNYPNPFNPTTTITFQLLERSFVVIDIFDPLGHKVETLVNSNLDRGHYSFLWDASNQATGVYFCKLYTKDFSQTIKIILVR